MLEKCVLRDLSTGKEFSVVLPMEEKELEKLISGKELIIVDADGSYPSREITDFSSIRLINQHIAQLTAVQEETGLTDKEIQYLFRISTLSVEETVQKVVARDFMLINLGNDTKDWQGTDEEKAAIYLNQQQIDVLEAFSECFRSTGGVVPDGFVDYIDWESVWTNYNLQHDWEILNDYSGNVTNTYLCRI